MGRDIQRARRKRAVTSFNPRARMGRDLSSVPVTVSFNKMFQSTRPHGARQSKSSGCVIANNSFNPRARMGRDCKVDRGVWYYDYVSIHAPAWGATEKTCKTCPNE